MRAQYLRLAYEFLFSLNIALVLRLQDAQTSLSSFESNLQFRINGSLRLNPHSHIGVYSGFLLIAFALALVIFVVFSLLSRFQIVGPALCVLTGLVSLLALPADWLYVTREFPVPPDLPNPPQAALFLELAAVVVCYVHYLRAKWKFPARDGILLLAVHFSFWGWLLLGGFYFWLAPFELIFPLAGFCSCLAWGIYVIRNRPFVPR